MLPSRTTAATFCRMIKIEHSIFALPWAWAGAVLAAGGMPPLLPLVMLTVAMVGVRSFAMGINRIVDLPFDRENPRTCERALVTGEITLPQAWLFCVVSALVFIAACACLNSFCLSLALPTLIVTGVYSLLKRLTPYCHYWLGACLGLAPLAGWLSVTPTSLGLAPLLLFCAVTLWVGAFDIYYAFQDLDFDTAFGIHSLPADKGPEAALTIAGFSHVLTSIFLLLFGLAAQLSLIWYAFWLGISLLLLVEHRIMRTRDLSRVNMAFFTLNGIVSPLVLLGIILGLVF
ncbi:UbiA-like polyprenyltransferase [uncultured Desulfovibrio sp.]|uniref:UbiA-like polyprenyltransferase n=1 Tax=uncultured Desulfovibrio sp. TaxID=167968 RepID=UPI00262F9B55|nr:UbiA-like polyprenyltransferase [uncultured Desulfovibrio sp.]